MRDTIEVLQAKAAKERQELKDAEARLEKAKAKAEENKRYTALRNLATSKGNIKAGQVFTCTAKELEVFKKAKAV